MRSSSCRFQSPLVDRDEIADGAAPPAATPTGNGRDRRRATAPGGRSSGRDRANRGRDRRRGASPGPPPSLPGRCRGGRCRSRWRRLRARMGSRIELLHGGGAGRRDAAAGDRLDQYLNDRRRHDPQVGEYRRTAGPASRRTGRRIRAEPATPPRCDRGSAPARETGPNLEPRGLPRGVAGDVPQRQRPRPDQAHVAGEDARRAGEVRPGCSVAAGGRSRPIARRRTAACHSRRPPRSWI